MAIQPDMRTHDTRHTTHDTASTRTEGLSDRCLDGHDEGEGAFRSPGSASRRQVTSRQARGTLQECNLGRILRSQISCSVAGSTGHQPVLVDAFEGCGHRGENAHGRRVVGSLSRLIAQRRQDSAQ
ncbi:hypothetical protein PMIN06_008222 [Paraphaeosphaeria minitans]